MNRFLSLIVVTLLLVNVGFSQQYGNEWINHKQYYYKFPIVKDGIYRINHQTLTNAGVPVESVTADKFQIFGKEREIPLYVRDGGDNRIDEGDYIEFYAQKNDGWLDSVLYDHPTDIGNPYFSLYSDTLYYFLTWTDGVTKRFVNDTSSNFSDFTPTSYVLEKSFMEYHEQYWGGYAQSDSYSSFYYPGEGWGRVHNNGAESNYSKTVAITTPSLYQGSDAPNALFEGKSNTSSNSAYSGLGNHHLQWLVGSSNYVVADTIFSGIRQTVITEEIPINVMSNGTTNVYFKIIGDQGATTDYQSISCASLIYPRTTVANQTFFRWQVVDATNQSKIRVDLTGTSLSSPVAYVYGGGIARKIRMVNEDGAWKGLIPNSLNGNQQDLVISSSSVITQVPELKPVNGNGVFKDFSLLNLENSYLILYNKVLQSSVNQYVGYRQSIFGGSHNVVLIESTDAWMQYGGGVPKHSLGNRRSLHHIYDLTTEKPIALFIAGKGTQMNMDPNSPATEMAMAPRLVQSYFDKNLVSPFGYPASDNCLTARWSSSTDYSPAIPTGRVAANNNDELNLYLDKVREYESNQNQNSIYNKQTKEWQKHILHFGGGSVAQEQNMYKSYLNNMKNTIEGPNYGGYVTSYFKQTSNPFNPVQVSEVNSHLSAGVSLMNFFGHASADGFDQSIDEPENWGNEGKYPIVIGNGCYSGDIFKPDNNSTSEKFVLIEDLGAIAFLSNTKLGFASDLNVISSRIYREMSELNYGGTLGEQVKDMLHHLAINSTSYLLQTTATQMTLHGDPVIKLNWHNKPEIDLTSQDVFFGPSQINLATDSIDVNVVLTNLGKSIVDTFDLTVKRHFPNSTIDSIYHLNISGLNYKDTFNIRMPLQADLSPGLNNFYITADIPSFIEEQYDEYGNNQVGVDFFIGIDGIIPVLPHDYAVVPRDSVVLKASTVNPLAGLKSYRFEIDTTDLFDSPFKKYAVKSGLGGVYEIFPNDWLDIVTDMPESLVLEDSVSYFWRVAVDSSVWNWQERSFQYIRDKEGWGQAHFFQFKNGEFNGVEYDRNQRKRHFQDVQAKIGAKVYDNANNNTQFNGTMWELNDQMMEYGICGTQPALHVGVVNPATLEVWGTSYGGANPNHSFGNGNNNGSCRARVEKFFVFYQNSANQLAKFQEMIEDAVPEGYYIVIYTSVRARYGQWSNLRPELFDFFNDLGATGISSSSPDRAFIVLTRKGDPSSTITMHAQSSGQYLELAATFDGPSGSGVETSTIIGPSAEWKTVYWKENPLEIPSQDSTRLVIRGLDWQKNVQIEIDTVFTHEDSILYLNTLIPAQQYPYLQLQAKYYDFTHLTPSQVYRWHVLYDKLPEAAIDGSSGYTLLPNSLDSLREGTEMAFAIDVRNIDDLPMDSLLVHYWITDKNQVVHPIPYERQDSLRVGATLRDTIRFSTIGLGGTNTLWMEVNPYTKGTNNEFTDQPEQAHFNNVLQLPFSIEEDDLNPILDVTFDGEHILNGDIINPRAEITISLKDDNPFLVMDSDADTTLFGIFLTNPEGEQKRIPFMDGAGNEVMQWIPANSSNLRFKIIWNASFEKNGTYKLMVQGSDKSGNLSGDIEYIIEFEVILESAITYLMNYPNPFSTRTQFVFTLTGMEVPDDMIIQIMTVTGRIVREITIDELGLIRIGRNITEYAWDGRDEFGDRLANGVYLYRVKTRMNGEEMLHINTGADKYFKKNWGKMYLMR